MGKAGQALRQVLDTYGISQNKLAVAMGTTRGNVHRWVKEAADPAADAVLQIRDGLEKINPIAAEEFIRLYLSRSVDESEEED